MSDYNELKCLAELACPGPWMQENDDLYFNDDGYTRHLMFTDSGHDVCDDEFCDDGHRDNLKFIAAANPVVVLALIAENERLTAWRVSGGHLLKASNARLHEVSVACATAEQERDQLRAEVAGLKTGYEAYERVNAELKAESERIERNRDMWKGQVELQAEELTSMRKDAEQWRALVGRAKDPVIGYTGCVICGSADHGGWSCQNHPGGKS